MHQSNSLRVRTPRGARGGNRAGHDVPHETGRAGPLARLSAKRGRERI